ncbi:hypothetical protein LguiB_010721 [Lonicera macranthoides]
MDVMGSSPVRSQNVSWGFAMALRWAFLEWLLMFMLFIEATFSYLVTKFARDYKLQIPCLLCSRLDHVMGKDRSRFYWDLVCGNHKLEISSLVHCHIQNKLVDVHGTCNKERISRGYAHNILQSTSIRSLADQLDEPLSTTIEQNESINSKNNFTVQLEQLIDDDLTSERLIHQDSATKPSVLDPMILEVVGNPHGRAENAAAIGHGLEELNWKQIEYRANTSELISFDEQVSREMLDIPEEAVETGQKSVTDNVDISKAVRVPIMTVETHIEVNPSTSNASLQMPNYLDLGDAYKLAVGNKGRQLSGKFSEQRSLKDSLNGSEDLKIFLSQRSFSRGLELPLNDISPRLSGPIDELKTPDASTSMLMHLLQRRVSLERNESSLSLDGSAVSDIEGESAVDRLKRQVEHDRKLMGALYKELEEERNASAIATNQAMAMITRLQEEKAALHMEALQCLRVMEDQAEFDGEALEKANELLAENEIKIRDIEAELELYRKKFGDISIMGNITEPNFVREKDNERCEIDDKEINAAKSSLLEFEDERLYIFQRLKKLEKELHLFSNNGLYLETDSGDISGSVQENGVSFQENDGREYDNLQKDDVIVYKENDGDLVAIEKEFSDLRVRMEALETDRSFLEHSINSLRNGNDGVKFVEEIACHLRELRRIGIRKRDQPTA